MNIFAVTEYTINAVDVNFFFHLGQPIVIILLAFLAVAGLLGMIGRIGNFVRLDIEASKWTSRFLAGFLYAVLFWLGLSMMFSYFGSSIIDIANGAILITGAIVSIIRRATSDQQGANRSLAYTYGFLGLIIVWTLIFSAVAAALPITVIDTVKAFFEPHFFQDFVKAFGWG